MKILTLLYLIQWLCVESLLSVMHILDARRIPGDRKSFFSDDTVKSIFQDIIERWDKFDYSLSSRYLEKNIKLLHFYQLLWHFLILLS